MSEELAWAAGFADGEGYFGYSLKSNGGAIAFVVSQSGSPELLYRLQTILGVGRVNGPYQSKAKNRKPHWRFVVNKRADFRYVVAALWPYLGTVKRAQAQLVLDFVKG